MARLALGHRDPNIQPIVYAASEIAKAELSPDLAANRILLTLEKLGYIK